MTFCETITNGNGTTAPLIIIFFLMDEAAARLNSFPKKREPAKRIPGGGSGPELSIPEGNRLYPRLNEN